MLIAAAASPAPKVSITSEIAERATRRLLAGGHRSRLEDVQRAAASLDRPARRPGASRSWRSAWRPTRRRGSSCPASRQESHVARARPRGGPLACARSAFTFTVWRTIYRSPLLSGPRSSGVVSPPTTTVPRPSSRSRDHAGSPVHGVAGEEAHRRSARRPSSARSRPSPPRRPSARGRRPRARSGGCPSSRARPGRPARSSDPEVGLLLATTVASALSSPSALSAPATGGSPARRSGRSAPRGARPTSPRGHARRDRDPGARAAQRRYVAEVCTLAAEARPRPPAGGSPREAACV